MRASILVQHGAPTPEMTVWTKRSQDAEESLAMFQLQRDGGDEALSSTALPTVLQQSML
jgi:hypothetical protein